MTRLGSKMSSELWAVNLKRRASAFPLDRTEWREEVSLSPNYQGRKKGTHLLRCRGLQEGETHLIIKLAFEADYWKALLCLFELEEMRISEKWQDKIGVTGGSLQSHPLSCQRYVICIESSGHICKVAGMESTRDCGETAGRQKEESGVEKQKPESCLLWGHLWRSSCRCLRRTHTKVPRENSIFMLAQRGITHLSLLSGKTAMCKKIL